LKKHGRKVPEKINWGKKGRYEGGTHTTAGACAWEKENLPVLDVQPQKVSWGERIKRGEVRAAGPSQEPNLDSNFETR